MNGNVNIHKKLYINNIGSVRERVLAVLLVPGKKWTLSVS